MYACRPTDSRPHGRVPRGLPRVSLEPTLVNLHLLKRAHPIAFLVVLGACGDDDTSSTTSHDPNGTANSAPVIDGTPSTEAAVGVPYEFVPNAIDADEDVLTFAVDNSTGLGDVQSHHGPHLRHADDESRRYLWKHRYHRQRRQGHAQPQRVFDHGHYDHLRRVSDPVLAGADEKHRRHHAYEPGRVSSSLRNGARQLHRVPPVGGPDAHERRYRRLGTRTVVLCGQGVQQRGDRE